MDVTQLDDEQLIHRYLAGRLPDSESDAFELYLSEHPDICPEIEQTLRFREGLARLRERGELDALLQTPASRRWVAYSAAASVAFATVAGLLWLQLRTLTPATLFLSPSALAARHHEPSAVRGSYVLARTRGSASLTEVALPAEPGAIELRILPSAVSSDGHYSVSLRRLPVAAEPASRDQIETGSVASDGYVTIYLDSSRLTPGDYEVSLSPVASGRSRSESDRFLIRLRSH